MCLAALVSERAIRFPFLTKSIREHCPTVMTKIFAALFKVRKALPCRPRYGQRHDEGWDHYLGVFVAYKADCRLLCVARLNPETESENAEVVFLHEGGESVVLCSQSFFVSKREGGLFRKQAHHCWTRSHALWKYGRGRRGCMSIATKSCQGFAIFSLGPRDFCELYPLFSHGHLRH